MSDNTEIFSIRLVIADFYLEKPIQGLDPCYSEFRGSHIKRVPIIRIFGANANGQKTCMHIHGVFPYLYIPYESKDFDSVNQALYQVAINIDKAINISLGQGSSEAQHVFKVQLVKGIPFYGYHRGAHQYLKIYMYNPRFVRRAANLLQNGSILGKVFHPHESHVPYVLQFMIDYNLYGMSFLHVPLEIVKFRKSYEDDEILYEGQMKETQILSTALVKKQSVSTLEVDIGSNFILNRFQLIVRNNISKHSNPGIEAIWNDEDIRRQKLVSSFGDDEERIKAVPCLEIPPTQDRPNVQPTESDSFYRAGLLSKLTALENSLSGSESLMDQTLSTSLQNSQQSVTLNSAGSTNTKEMRRTFNLRKLLANSVYPEECKTDENLMDASCIENHLSAKSSFQLSSSYDSDNLQSENKNLANPVLVDESEFLDDTLVDEELLTNLTQEHHVPFNATLRLEDMELLDVLKDLEEDNDNKNPIDLDSSLAPLSQPLENIEFTPEKLDKETIASVSRHDQTASDNEDDGNMHDFSIVLDDLDEWILKFSQSQNMDKSNEIQETKLPQMDGADDCQAKSPDRNKTRLKRLKPQKTPPQSPKSLKTQKYVKSLMSSPRTPKLNVSSRYAPLPMVFFNRKKNFQSDDNEQGGDSVPPNKGDGENNLSSVEKRVAPTKLRRKTISSAQDLFMSEKKRDLPKQLEEAKRILTRRQSLRRKIDLDKTHITCSLTPQRKSERQLKVCKIEEVTKSSTRRKTKVKLIEPKNQEVAGKTLKDPAKVLMKNEKEALNVRLKKIKVRICRQNLEQLALNLEKSRLELKKKERESTAEEKGRKEKDTFENAEVIEKTIETIGDNQPQQDKEKVTRSFKNKIGDFGNRKSLLCTSSLKDLKIHSKDPVELVPSVTGNENNVRKNLDELARLLETSSQIQGSPRAEDSVFEACRENFESYSQNFIATPETISNHLEKLTTMSNEDEEIAASDTEAEKSSFRYRRTPSARRSRHSFSRLNASKKKNNIAQSPMNSHLQTPNQSLILTENFCDSPLNINSPSVFSDLSSPVFSPNMHIQEHRRKSEDTVVLAPLIAPPNREETLKACQKLQIYEHEFQQPFYSNPLDVTKAKEIGFTVLQIPGNKLNDLSEFQSVLGSSLSGLAMWRRKKIQEIGDSQISRSYRTAERIREFFATETSTTIQPQVQAPTRHEAKIWLKARELIQNRNYSKDEKLYIEQDSPIKIRRQKVTMMFNDETTDGADNDDNMNCTSCSLSLTPLTPSTPLIRTEEDASKNSDLTPLSSTYTKEPPMDTTIKRKSKRRSMLRKSVRLSLSSKLQAAAEMEGMQNAKEISRSNSETPAPDGQCDSVTSSQQSYRSTDDSSSISSQVVLAELDRSSFVKRLNSEIALQKGNQLDVSFGLSSATLNNTFGFKVNLENLQQAKSDIECNYLTTMVMELFVATRDDLYPNPEYDEIRCIFYAIDNNIPNKSSNNMEESTKTKTPLPSKACGYILVNNMNDDLIKIEGKIHGLDADIETKIVRTEVEALEALLDLCALWDPDIYAGYEIEMSSWGYLIDRAKFLCLNIAPLLSRVPSQRVRELTDEDREQLTDLDVEMKLCGRILLDVWRLMRSEIALTSYTFENVVYHILHKRCPWHSYRDLTSWFIQPNSRWIVLEYYLERVRGVLDLLDQLDLLGRTSEMAKLIGIQFYEVLSRGSQFRVESMMLRIAKPRNLVPLSPSVQQRAHMRAPEYLPLILEPQSRFYPDPVIVLDFQSLYPSMIIAYNYCFSTCLGRVEHLGHSSPFEFGASQLRVSPTMLRKLLDEDLVNISPCGVVFVKSKVREGILPRMLTEILDTRQMVKQSMKLHKSNSALQRILHSRQLGLKLMANVTYGYTAANFSGRMPAVEVGDSVVAKGRETLERAIKMVEANEKWGVKVVYGDTDSLFVLVPGRNREQAFKIGEEIAEAATKDNPQPVKLKLEKVYQPCILQTKKRYVGYMYETPDQVDPIYEAKGIETVRRDGCPAVAKMLEKVLRILFQTADVSQVKQYVCRQFTKLLSGRANLQDLIFAKEFRGLNGYKPTACVPALEMTRKWIRTDPRRIPRRGERVPFIITNGPPGVPLIRLVRYPHDVLADGGLKINAIYYITKAIIPPLNRCLLLIGADVNEWFASLPRKILLTPALSTAKEFIAKSNQQQQQKKSTISQYFSTTNCIIDCGRQTKDGICNICSKDSMKCVVALHSKIAQIERSYFLTQQICQACCGRIGNLNCGSLDCPVVYVFEVKRRNLEQIEHFQKLLKKF